MDERDVNHSARGPTLFDHVTVKDDGTRRLVTVFHLWGEMEVKGVYVWYMIGVRSFKEINIGGFEKKSPNPLSSTFR